MNATKIVDALLENEGQPLLPHVPSWPVFREYLQGIITPKEGSTLSRRLKMWDHVCSAVIQGLLKVKDAGGNVPEDEIPGLPLTTVDRLLSEEHLKECARAF